MFVLDIIFGLLEIIVKIIFVLIGHFLADIFKWIFKILFIFLKAIVWSIVKIIIKGNTKQRLSFMGLLTVDWICYANGFMTVQLLSVLGIIIIGGMIK